MSLIAIILSVTTAQAADVFWDVRVYIVDSPTKTFAWTASTTQDGQPVDGYEFRAWNFERNKNWYYEVTATQITITRPATGMFKFYVRAYKGVPRIYSEWAASDDPTKADIWVDNVFVRQGGWSIYWRLPAPIIR